VDIDNKQQAEKEKKFKNLETIDDLSWLYGYNFLEIGEILRQKRGIK
jgi:hypothetical protein